MSITSISHKVSARFAAGAVGAAMIVSLGLGAAAPALAAGLSTTQVQSILSLLSSFGADQATINNVQAALTGQAVPGTSTGGTTTGSCTTAFTRTLQVGSTGADVKALQQILNASADTRVAATGAGSPGNESTYFGPATKAAVIKFQNKYASEVLTPSGLTAGTGLVGAATRAKLNTMCGTTGGSTGGTTTPTGPGITVSAAVQPANTLAPESASRVPFTTFTLTNNTSGAVTVNSVTVQRTGLASDSVFSGLVLLDQNGLQIGVSSTLNSNHQANLGSVGFTLNAGQSATFTVAGNMASDLSSFTGQVAGVSVVAINTSVPVNGALPITGASQTINASLSIGTAIASISSFDPNNAQTRNIGDTAVTFSGVRLQAGSAEDVKLFSIRWRLNGSVSTSDLANLQTYVNGTAYANTISSDGRYLTATFPGGILVQKGASADVYIRGDVTGSNASGRVAEFDVDKASDIYVVGQTYGYGIIPTAGSTSALSTDATHKSTFSTSQPFFQGSTVSIKGGQVTTITNASSVAAQNVAINVPNQTLGGFTTNFIGEPVSVQTMVFSVATSSGGKGVLTNVSIVDQNGNVVAGPVDMNVPAKTLTFSNTITFPVGSATYTLKGTVSTAATNGETFRLSTDTSSWTNVTGQTTGNTISLGSTAVTMNLMTVRGATLAVSLSSTPAAQNIVAGGQNVVFANVQLDASQSGEDIRINSIPLYLTTNATTPATNSGATNNLTACQIWNGNVGSGTPLNYGSNIINSPSVTASSSPAAANTFNFNNSLVVPKGTVTTLTLTCNVTSGVTGTYTWGLLAETAFPENWAIGNTSNSSLAVSLSDAALSVANAAAGAQSVAANGSLAVSLDASSPAFTVVAGGTNGVTVGQYKFRPSNEGVSLSKLGMTLSGSTGSVTRVHVFNGSTEIGTAIFTGSTATSTFANPVTLPVNVDTVLTVKADLAQVGTGFPGVIGDTVKISPNSAEGTGVSSGQTIQVGASGTVAGVQLFKSFPTVARIPLSTSNVSGNVAIMHFSITANSTGPVGLDKLTFTVATSTTGATVTKANLYAFEDSAFSRPISGQNSGGQIGSEQEFAGTGFSGTATFVPGSATAPVEVPAGSTYYFELRATVTPGSGSNWAVNTTLNGDSSDISSIVYGTYKVATSSALSASKFVWSDNATTTAVRADVDWTNGFGIPGLPANGITN